MKYENILKLDRNKLEVFLGYDDNEKLNKIDLSVNPSVIITGTTGTSKSVFLNQILLQLICTNSPDELKILTINPTIVELLPYRKSDYNLNNNISIKCTDVNEISKVVTDRIDFILESGKTSFKTYNNSNDIKLPYLVIAIDEATLLLQKEYSEYNFTWIMSLCKKLGIILILTTNNTYSKFFEDNYNELATCRISFDLSQKEQADLVNIKNSHLIEGRDFLMKDGSSSSKCWHSFDFDEKIVDKML